MQKSNEAESDDEADDVHVLRRHAEVLEQRLERLGHERFADPAEPEAGQGNAELAAGQVGIKVVGDVQRHARQLAAILGAGLQAGTTDLDQGKLRGDKEAVEQYQGHYKESFRSDFHGHQCSRD